MTQRPVAPAAVWYTAKKGEKEKPGEKGNLPWEFQFQAAWRAHLLLLSLTILGSPRSTVTEKEANLLLTRVYNS